ncbi:hypothetical protein QN277_010732 [Acacia crassicarpa]|uniref:Uncharacterized protein n=1 Tax=Acacia crassicarpa TaxID=499986 RepID=A0AAE1IMA2_9FABA|nr:hypothetical protein QN277_010732 [Acacia crassicarpa]
MELQDPREKAKSETRDWLNNVDANLGSPGLRRSSPHASHDPHCDRPDSSPHIPSPSPQPSIFYLDIDFG